MSIQQAIIDEDALIKRILPKIEERVRMNVVKSLISTLEEQIYPPEERFKEEFVKRVKKASRSKGKVFKDINELSMHLKSLGR